MEERYKNLRSQLEGLGYHLSLKPDSVPLVEKLVADLLQTTESLRKYMKIAKDVIGERDNLLLGAEPYKCDNAKLVRECNDLHLAFLQFREQNEKLQKDLRKRITTLEKEKNFCESEREKLQNHIRLLELESAKKTNKILSLQSAKLGIKPTLKSSSTTTLLRNRLNTKENSECEAMALAEQRISNLMKEIGRLKEQNLELSDANNAYKTQLTSRNKEIQRLSSLLEGGRPIEALNQDCCYKDADIKMSRMQDEINLLKKKNSDVEKKLKDAVSKQHEAMKRALNLAERNKVLEKEMRDIDFIALTVESECNSTVKCNAEKVSRLQDRIHETVLQVQELEREAADLRREKRELIGDFEAVKTEKRHLQTVLETALDDKKRLNDRINQFTIIENDLNLEIDRLVRLSASQKQRIAEMECRLLSGKLDDTLGDQVPNHKPKGKRTKKSTKPISPNKSSKHDSITIAPLKLYSQAKMRKGNKKHMLRASAGGDVNDVVPDNTPESRTVMNELGRISDDDSSDIVDTVRMTSNCSNPVGCVKELKKLIESELRNKDVCLTHLREIIGKEVDNLQSQANMSFEHFKAERDYYMKECRVLMEKLKTLCNKNDEAADVTRKLNEKEQLIMTLQHENRCLSQEKHNLMTRLETSRDRLDNDLESGSLRSSSKRLERERDLLKADLQRLEEERDALRQRLKEVSENYSKEKSRLESLLREAEDEVRKLESERRDFMNTQGSRRAAINNLQDDCDTLRDQLRKCQSELNQQRAVYSQLKTLHEQTDMALADSQSQLIQLEKEMHSSQERLRSFEKQGGDSDKEIMNLRNDIAVMKGNLAKIDREKDALLSELDEKTEKIAALELELKSKHSSNSALETAVGDLKKKISMTMDNSSSREQLLRNATTEVQKLQQDLEAAIRAKDLAYQENRRIQEDLAACTSDCRIAHNDLGIARRQIDDLKRQLQQYVAEVKRTEDLISQKEIERSEMLDHYRSLSQEATVLENSNHSLENEATQTKVQLSLALDHANDLENKLETQATMIRSYEKQIADLTAQIARMEIQLSQQSASQERAESEIANMRELCVKLDKQKDGLMKQLNDVDNARVQVGRDADRFRRESATLQNTLTSDRNSYENMEKLLAECRQECVDQKLLNQEMQSELQRCKGKVEELQIKLTTASEQLDLFQDKALDYSQQNKQLRREIANERFFRAKEDDSKRRNMSKRGSDGDFQPSSMSSKKAIGDTYGNSRADDVIGVSKSDEHFNGNSFTSPTNGNGGRSASRSKTVAATFRKSLSFALPVESSHMFTAPTTEGVMPAISELDESDDGTGAYQSVPDYIGSRIMSQSGKIQPILKDPSSDTSFRGSGSRIRSQSGNIRTSLSDASVLGNVDSSSRRLAARAADMNSLHSTKGKSVSADYFDGSVDESVQNLSMLGSITDQHSQNLSKLNTSSGHLPPTRDKEQNNPMDDSDFRDQALNDKSCACLRVCRCHDKSESGPSVTSEHYSRPFENDVMVVPTTFGQQITCVFTNCGPTVNRYSASYSFACDNSNTTQALRTRMTPEEYNKQQQV